MWPCDRLRPDARLPDFTREPDVCSPRLRVVTPPSRVLLIMPPRLLERRGAGAADIDLFPQDRFDAIVACACAARTCAGTARCSRTIRPIAIAPISGMESCGTCMSGSPRSGAAPRWRPPLPSPRCSRTTSRVTSCTARRFHGSRARSCACCQASRSSSCRNRAGAAGAPACTPSRAGAGGAAARPQDGPHRRHRSRVARHGKSGLSSPDSQRGLDAAGARVQVAASGIAALRAHYRREASNVHDECSMLND